MKILLCLSLLFLWLSPHVAAADELPRELERVRRALIIELNDSSLERQKDMTQLEDVLKSRCGLRVTRRNSDDVETSALTIGRECSNS